MSFRARRPSAASDREGPPGAVPVQGYGDLLASLPPGTVAAALMAALRCHEPEWNPGWDAYACQCRDKGGTRRLWPCPEVRAVTAVLAGEEEL